MSRIIGLIRDYGLSKILLKKIKIKNKILLAHQFYSKEFIKSLTIVSYKHIKYANIVSRHFLENYSTSVLTREKHLDQ